MELSAAEGRVLGCLIEQEMLAPTSVPVSLNSLRLACNQTSGRDPVVAYDDRTVEDTLLVLKSRGLARFVPPSTEAPTTRYRHRADDRWRMGEADLAVLAVLLVRRVLTLAEVRAHAQRLLPHITPGEVEAVLDALAARTPKPFAARVAGLSGDREVRWVEVLTAPAPDGHDGDARPPDGGAPAPVPASASHLPAPVAEPAYVALVARVADLERRLAEALDRPRPPEWAAPPPPPPPVEVTPPSARHAIRAAEWRDPALALRPAADIVHEAPDIAGIADRLRDVERRLARIEAELGALR